MRGHRRQLANARRPPATSVLWPVPCPPPPAFSFPPASWPLDCLELLGELVKQRYLATPISVSTNRMHVPDHRDRSITWQGGNAPSAWIAIGLRLCCCNSKIAMQQTEHRRPIGRLAHGWTQSSQPSLDTEAEKARRRPGRHNLSCRLSLDHDIVGWPFALPQAATEDQHTLVSGMSGAVWNP